MRRFILTLILGFCTGCQGSSFTTHDGGGKYSDGGSGFPDLISLPKCPGQEITLRGTVLAPNGQDPVPNAAVFIAAAPPEVFPLGIQCEVCAQPGTGDHLWYTTSSFDGKFTLQGICPGQRMLVIQNGRFRRILELDLSAPGPLDLTPEQTRLPRRNQEQHTLDAIPRMAVGTGDYDQMECVLRKIGLEDTAFDLYENAKHEVSPQGLPSFSTLVNDLGRMKNYSIIFVNCTDDTFESELQKTTVRQNITQYVQLGGRIYVTDWSYDWVEQVESLSPFIDFEPGVSDSKPEPQNEASLGEGGLMVNAQVKAPELAQWLGLFPNTILNGAALIQHFLEGWVMMFGVTKDVKVWVEGEVRSANGTVSGVKPLTVSFNFQNCGKILFSSYHTEGREGGLFPQAFPDYCVSQTSPQDRILEYLIFDIANCVTPIE